MRTFLYTFSLYTFHNVHLYDLHQKLNLGGKQAGSGQEGGRKEDEKIVHFVN